MTASNASSVDGDAQPLDVLVVGAGFSGLYLLHRLRGLGLKVKAVDRADDVGGTWFWNRYPGARCDIESIDYCYSFDSDLVREWRWTERYAAQPEILSYLQHVAARFDLRRDITLGIGVESAQWQERTRTWQVGFDDGSAQRARFLVMATGNLSQIKAPDLPGLDEFAGEWFHTGDWPRQPVDLRGKTVAVVGTGSSGVQTITAIAEQVGHLYVLQRTPNYSMPAQNGPLTDERWHDELANWDERRQRCRDSESGVPLEGPTQATAEVTAEQRHERFELGWQRGGISALSAGFTDFFTDPDANLAAQEFARMKIRQIVRNPEVAEMLSPRHHIGTKRTCTDTGYFEVYNHDHVELVDLQASPLVGLTHSGVQLGGEDPREIDVDTVIFAIGFDAITGALAEVDIRGVGGLSLATHWKSGPRTYLGLMSSGFPNLFMVTGPGSPSVLSNMAVSIEQHVDWIADCLAYLNARGEDRIEATASAEEQWLRHVADLAAPTLYPQAQSWYVGANIHGKPRVFMPYVAGCGQYRRESEAVARDGYSGTVIGAPRHRSSSTPAPIAETTTHDGFDVGTVTTEAEAHR